MTDIVPHTAATSATAPTAHVARGVALWSIFGFWAFYLVLNTARMAIAEHEDQFNLLLRRGAVVVVGVVLTFGMYFVLRRLEGTSMRFLLTTAFLVAIPASIIYAICNYAAFYLLNPPDSILQEMAQMHSKEKMTTLAVITEYAVSWYFFIAAWCVLYALSGGVVARRTYKRGGLPLGGPGGPTARIALSDQSALLVQHAQFSFHAGAAAAHAGSRAHDHEFGDVFPQQPDQRSRRGCVVVRRDPDAAPLPRHRANPLSGAPFCGD